MEIHIKKCAESDIITLSKISRETYEDTFSVSNSQSTMDKYLNYAFSEQKLYNELLNKDSHFYFFYVDSTLAGYIKLNESEAQTDINDPNSMELERIYLKQPYQGKGLGKTLLNYAVNIAAENDKLYIWLGVWEKNTKAIQFYKRNGFYKIHTHPFIMGSEEQTDFIMKKDLQ